MAILAPKPPMISRINLRSHILSTLHVLRTVRASPALTGKQSPKPGQQLKGTVQASGFTVI